METIAGMEWIIWHNPRCSKSRETLALLTAHGITPVERRYLESPASIGELRQLCALLGKPATALLRRKETAFLDWLAREGEPDEAQALALMASQPGLMERPIVVHGARARLGRPPEAVLELL